MEQRIIDRIGVGMVGDKVGWMLYYTNGTQESFSLHLGVARQFMQNLQELVLLAEHQHASAAQGNRDASGVSETITMRLMPPGD